MTGSYALGSGFAWTLNLRLPDTLLAIGHRLGLRLEPEHPVAALQRVGQVAQASVETGLVHKHSFREKQTSRLETRAVTD